MKLHYIIFILLLNIISTNYVVAQVGCGTEYGIITPDQLYPPSYGLKSTSSGSEMKNFEVQFHIVRDDEKAGGLPDSMLPLLLEELNEAFDAANISFYSCEDIHYINDDYYYNLDSDQKEEWIIDFFTFNEDAINIYFFPYLEKNGASVCGYTYSPAKTPCKYLFLNNNCAINNKTLIHEMGHFFGLLHTFDVANGAELVTRVNGNCATAGDLICDTQATADDLSLTVNSLCVYTGGGHDANGDVYTPDTDNFMSYGRRDCDNKFTLGQIDVMRSWADDDWLQQFNSTLYLNDLSLIFDIVVPGTYIEFENITVESNATVSVIACQGVDFNNSTIEESSTLTVDAENITIEGSSIDGNSTVTLDASDGVYLNKGTEIKLGSTLEIK